MVGVDEVTPVIHEAESTSRASTCTCIRAQRLKNLVKRVLFGKGVARYHELFDIGVPQPDSAENADDRLHGQPTSTNVRLCRAAETNATCLDEVDLRHCCPDEQGHSYLNGKPLEKDQIYPMSLTLNSVGFFVFSCF